MKAMTRSLVLAMLLGAIVPGALAWAQANDPVMGTWALNVAKSTYSQGGGAKSSTRTYTAVAGGYKFSSKGIDADGKPVATDFTVKFDDKYYPMTGSPTSDSIMVKRIDANTTESTQKKGGAIVIHTSRVVSKDGKTLTGTTKGTNAAGKAYTNVEVFDKKP